MDGPPPRARRKRDTRERVLNAATDLFAARGYAATSIAAICHASGVLPSSVYWEFGNKAGIFAAVLEDSAKRWLEQSGQSVIQAVRNRPNSGIEPLAVYFDHMAKALAEGPAFLRLMLMVALERRHADPHALDIVRSHRARAVEGLSRLLAASGLGQFGLDGVTAHDVALLTIACFDGAFTAAQMGADAADLRRMFTLLHSAMTATVRNPQSPTTR